MTTSPTHSSSSSCVNGAKLRRRSLSSTSGRILTPLTFVWAVVLTSAVVNVVWQWWQGQPSPSMSRSSILYHAAQQPTTKPREQNSNNNNMGFGYALSFFSGGDGNTSNEDSTERIERDMEEVIDEEVRLGESIMDQQQLQLQQQEQDQQSYHDLTSEERNDLFPYGRPLESDLLFNTPIFYHVYVPPTLDGIKNSKRIVWEQLDQIKRANQIQKEKHNHTLSIYFNLIGHHSGHLNSTLFIRWCHQRGFKCTFMEHHDKAMEDVTLQRVHDYCRATSGADMGNNVATEARPRVVYMHNKGSYTRKPPNERWRFKMTDAVSSDHCLHPELYNSDCNLCGMFFTAERGLFMAGNFWTATCEYVAKLLPVRSFEVAMSNVATEAFKMRLRYLMYFKTQEMRSGVFGIDRYATEYWSASHPDVKPCDYSMCLLNGRPLKASDVTNDFLSWIKNDPKAANTQPVDQLEHWWVPRAPRLAIKFGAPLTDLRRNKDIADIRKYPDARFREFFFLAGNLFRWYHLYQQPPPPESWVWKYYPDGAMWKAAVTTHGENATMIVTQNALHEERKSGRNPFLEKILYTENKTGLDSL